jgi:serine protease
MYDPTMASAPTGLAAAGPALPTDTGPAVALGGSDETLLTAPQPSRSASGFSPEQADALMQQYLQQVHSTELGSLDPWMDLSFATPEVEPLAASADTVDSLTGLSSQTTQTNSQSPAVKELGTILGAREFDGQGTSNPQNFYSFTLNSDSDLHISLEGASRSQNLWLYEIQPSSSAVPYELVRFSPGWFSEPSPINLSDQGPGEYLVRVDNSASAQDYTLNLDVSPTGGIEHIQGGLTADSWEFAGDTRYTVYSGEGNVNFGQGEFDLIDFSQYTLDDVIGWNPVTPDGGGMLFDPGNGLRLFDAMQLNDGHHILFEGIDRLAFADGQVDLAVVPSDSLFDQQWNLHMTGVHNAWRFTQGSEDVLIGIQDTGLGLDPFGNSHPDLRPTLNTNRSQLRDSYIGHNLQPMTFHGTKTQGIIAARSNIDSQESMSGINWESNVINLNVSNTFFGLGISDATELMTNYSSSQELPIVINMSIEWPDQEPGFLPEFEALVKEYEDDALFVISSGNQFSDQLSYPAILAQKHDNVVSVGASLRGVENSDQVITPGQRASYSNYGDGLSLMAPTNVITTSAQSTISFPFIDFGYDQYTGTSAAAPHVTGIASLAWSVNPDLTASDINSIMQKTAHDLSELGDEFEYGAGLVNADAAVRKAMASANHVSNWNALGDQPLSLASFISQSAEAPVFGITATQFEPEHPVESVETGDEAVADAAAEAATPWWNFPVSLPTFDVNSTWANLDWQPPEIAIIRPDITIPEFSVPEFSMPSTDWVPPTDFALASLPTVDALTSPLIEGLNEPLVEAIA